MAKRLFYFDDWSNPPCPSKYICTTATIVNDARNIKGNVVGAVVRENILSIEMSWNVISCEDWQKLLSKFDSKKGGSFFRKVSVYDQSINDWRTSVFYVSDREGGELGILDDNKKPQYWRDASLTLVEK